MLDIKRIEIVGLKKDLVVKQKRIMDNDAKHEEEVRIKDQ
jgi:hypothetical protein